MTDKFSVFYYTCRSFDDCCVAFDTADSHQMSDDERSKLCKRQCQCFCWPLCFTFDIVSCPYRCSKHYITKCTKPVESITTQPKI